MHGNRDSRIPRRCDFQRKLLIQFSITILSRSTFSNRFRFSKIPTRREGASRSSPGLGDATFSSTPSLVCMVFLFKDFRIQDNTVSGRIAGLKEWNDSPSASPISTIYKHSFRLSCGDRQHRRRRHRRHFAIRSLVSTRNQYPDYLFDRRRGLQQFFVATWKSTQQHFSRIFGEIKRGGRCPSSMTSTVLATGDGAQLTSHLEYQCGPLIRVCQSGTVRREVSLRLILRVFSLYGLRMVRSIVQ